MVIIFFTPALSIGRCLGQLFESESLADSDRAISKTLKLLALWDLIFAIGEMHGLRIASSIRCIVLGIRIGLIAKVMHSAFSGRVPERVVDQKISRVAYLQGITIHLQAIDLGYTLLGREPLGSQVFGSLEFILRALFVKV